MKRPAHLTLVDADRYSALVSRCTEQRERAEKAEARIEELEKKLRRYEGVLQEIATTRLFISGKPPAPSFAEWCQTLAKSALAAGRKP